MSSTTYAASASRAGLGPARRRLISASSGVLALQLVLTAVAVAANWPAQFGGEGVDASAEFLTRGTAISAPLLPLFVLALSIAALLADRAVALAGTLGVGVVAGLTVVGSLGEAVAAPTAEVGRAVLLASGAIGLLLAGLLIGLVLGTLRELSRDRAGSR